MKYRIFRKILSVISFFMCATLVTGTVIVNDNLNAIANAMGTETFKVISDANAADKDLEYFESDYENVTDLLAAGKQIATQVQEEGSVLLKNDNNALPLAKGAKVSLLGVTSYDPVYGGTGSGTIDVSAAVDFVTSLENAGLVINSTLADLYTAEDWAVYKRTISGSYGGSSILINEAPWTVVDEAAGSTLGEFGDAAIFIIGRVGGEGYDLIRKECDGVDSGDGLGPDYLGLNANELSVLEGLKQKKAAGEIKKIIVLINYAGMIEADFIKDDAIDAALWIGAIGVGGAAIGNLLVGDASPSGRLPDTMWMNNNQNPVNANYGAWIFENGPDFDVPIDLGTGIYPEATLSSYSVYQEGMYLGYRYTETRYEDVVLGTQNAGDYNYENVVAYPFGYGLSYADFELSGVTLAPSGDREYTVNVTVTNISQTHSGKLSVPVYVSKPYGDYAKANQIQVPSVELIDFAKTKVLAPGESEKLTLTLDEKFFASYDAFGAKGYVLMDGDYYVAVGGSAHDAVNNVLAAKAADGISVNASKMTGNGDANLVKKVTLSFDSEKYAYSDAASSIDGEVKRVTNLFDFADINLYEGRGDNHVDYYSRENWNAVSLDMAAGHAVLRMTEQMARDIYAQVPEQTGNYNNAKGVPRKYKQPIPKDDVEYPEYEVEAGIPLIKMMYDENGTEISFFDPAWDTFLNQLSWDDTVRLVSSGFHLTEAVESVAKPETNDENGPNGFGGWAFRDGYYTNSVGLAYRTEAALGHVDADGNLTDQADPVGHAKMTGFPANGILAATFNKELAEAAGLIIGEDGLWSGCSGLYGTGLNIHRTPYLGRTCEYFSECGTLSGIMGAYECRGIESKGVHVYNKHCALNDQENCRHGVQSWVPEQALREIYLRAFELPIVDGGAFNTMASFSRFGVQSAAACTALAADFLRGECGMRGIIVTDAYGDMDGSQNCDPYFEMVYGIYTGGSDIPDGATPMTQRHFDKFKRGYGEMAWKMRESAKRVLYQTVWSNAMNGVSPDTHVIKVMPWWQTALYAADVVFGVLFAGSMLWTGLALWNEKKKKTA